MVSDGQRRVTVDKLSELFSPQHLEAIREKSDITVCMETVLISIVVALVLLVNSLTILVSVQMILIEHASWYTPQTRRETSIDGY